MHLQGHSGAAFFLQCRECGMACGDYDSFVTHQNTCGAFQGGCTAAERLSTAEGQDKGMMGQVQDSSGVHDESHAGDNDDAEIVVHVDSEAFEDAGDEGQGRLGPGHMEQDSRSDDENSVEVVEDDNLPVHFMVKEEMAESPASSS